MGLEFGGHRLDEARDDAHSAARVRHGEQALVTMLHDLERERNHAANAYRAVVRSLAAALEARDGYTGGHSEAVHSLSVAVARRLGLGPAEVEEVRTVALLHDIGKIGVPDDVLHKNGPLTEAEWEMMRRHPVIGERILRPLPGMAAVARAVRAEHERWDGSGYPDRLRGEEIPLAARIVLACDAHHAMVSDRPYRRALGPAAARAELRRCAGSQFDPAVIEALLECLDEPAAPEPVEAPETADGTRPERELRALITVAAAVAGAFTLEDVIETAAEEACAALGAASLSIDRWERDQDRLRTLINVGVLGPGEERRPEAEVYLPGDYPGTSVLLATGRPQRAWIGDPDCDPAEAALLRSLGKAASVEVPVIFGEEIWGLMYATRGRDGDPFSDGEVRFLEAISGQVAGAIGRGELFSQLSELAFQDSLTGLANRRALEQWLEPAVEQAVEEGHDLALLVCDLDHLKLINDRHGHDAGDAALRRVADTLSAVAKRHSPHFAARLSGDEFCLALPRCDLARARELAERACSLMARGEGVASTLSVGVATLGGATRRATDLLRAADAALYQAKRSGRGRICVAGDAPAEPAPAQELQPSRRAFREQRDPAQRAHVLLAEGLAALDALPDGTALERLEAVLVAGAGAFDAPHWGLSFAPPGAQAVRTVHAIDLRDLDETPEPGTDYALEDYPATARLLAEGGAFWTTVGDAHGDPAERALLAKLEMEQVLAIGVPTPDGAWLLELYGDARSLPLAEAAPALRLLAAEAVRRYTLPGRPGPSESTSPVSSSSPVARTSRRKLAASTGSPRSAS
jgi:diguanylate cyclase (GGDEF)-like protein